MEVFHAVIEAGSVTGAAKLLNVSQPAITNMLRHIEDQLAFPLFERVKGRLEATAEGRLLYEETNHVFDRVDAVRRLVLDIKQAKVGYLTIACSPNFSVVLMPKIVASFGRLYPDIRIRLHVRRQLETTDMVAGERVDLGVALMSAMNPRVERTSLRKGNIVVLAPKGHRFEGLRTVQVADLRGERLIAFGAEQGFHKLVNGILAENRVDVNVVCEVNVMSMACKLVEEGAGVALVDSVSHFHLAYPQLVFRELVPNVELDLELLVSRNRRRTIVADQFITHMRKHLRELM